jgi:hypothetical protein
MSKESSRHSCSLIRRAALAAVLMASAATAAAQQRESIDRTFGNDRFVAGGEVNVSGPVSGDLLAAGGRVEIASAVPGDMVVAGGELRLREAVGDTLYAAGGRVEVQNSVAGNARIAGGEVNLDRRARIGGNATIAGGSVRIDAAVDGALSVGGGRVRLDGPVGGDVEVGADRLELGPNARITGALRYASRQPLERDPAAVVSGTVERRVWQRPSDKQRQVGRKVARAVGWIWISGLVILAGMMAAVWPVFAERVAATARQRWGASLLLGFVLLICLPVAAIVLFVSLVGIPLGLLLVVGFVALLLVGYVSSGIALGSLAAQSWTAAGPRRATVRFASAALGMLALALAAQIPFIGGWIAFAALLIGIGILGLQARRAIPTGTAQTAS